MIITQLSLTNSEIIKIVDEMVHNERNRDLLKMRYVDGLTIAELSRKFDLSDDAVKKIIKKNKSLFV